MKNFIISRIQNADIKQDDWYYSILESITNQYAKGYLSARIGAVNGNVDFHSEYFREMLLEWCSWNIWK